MEVILLKSVAKVGRKDEIVSVADGYAQHALFPKKLAIPATAQAIATLKKRLSGIVAERDMQHALLDKAIAAIDAHALVYNTKATAQGGLFSKIDTKDIAEFIMKTHRISLDPKQMRIVEGMIKHVGVYTIEVTDGEYKARFSLTVQAE